MSTSKLLTGIACAALGLQLLSVPVAADEAPTKVDNKGLPHIGDDKFLDKNPFGPGSKDNKTAIEVGMDAYGQNCARCHGLEMISGGIAPDLRHVPLGEEGDALFKERMTHGAQIGGVTKMPVFAGLLPQETLWAVRAYMVSQHIDD